MSYFIQSGSGNTTAKEHVSRSHSCGKYRPVSLLTILSKTIERAASKQVTEFLSRNNVLNPNQSGFKSGHSTETALSSVTEALKTARAAAHSSALVLRDLSAARGAR